MKKYLIILSVFVLATSLLGCEGQKAQAPQQVGTGHSNVKFVDNTKNSAESQTSTADNTETKISEPDINISSGDTNIIYSKANEIATDYNKYLGKTIRIKGNYKAEYGKNRNYYYCTVTDPTACCSAGFEFILKDKSKPNLGDNATFTVQGTLHSYKEGDNLYLELIDATII